MRIKNIIVCDCGQEFNTVKWFLEHLRICRIIKLKKTRIMQFADELHKEVDIREAVNLTAKQSKEYKKIKKLLNELRGK